MTKPTAIIIATPGITTNLLYETLVPYVEVKQIIIEKGISKRILLKRRIRKTGLLNVIGQIFFIILIPPFLKLRSKNRIQSIIQEHGLKNQPLPNSLILDIGSVNNSSIIPKVQSINPDLIFINGTRIISKSILEQLPVRPMNIHVGITPKYRGIHGGYWALFNDDRPLFGTTLHYVNSGIDSGEIIAQKTIDPAPEDNFATYPVLQYCGGLELIKLELTSQQKSKHQPLTSESYLYYHPTLIQYLKKRLFNGVK